MGSRVDHNDAVVGLHARRLRIARGISQTVIAELLNVTFQQVQKYESGSNRLSPSRIIKLAQFFQVPISALFDGVGPHGAQQDDDTLLQLLSTRVGLRLAEAFISITDGDLRERIVKLVEGIANTQA